MGQVWEGTSPKWDGAAPPQGPKAPRVWGRGRTHLTWGASFPPLPPWPHPRWVLGAAAPLGVETLKGVHPPPSPLYIVEVLRAANT